MNTELFVGIGGLILSVLTYFAGVVRTEKRLQRDDRNERIRHVLNRYMEFRRSNQTGGYDGLQKAGASTLCSSEEIMELALLIIAHGEKHPLGPDHENVFSGVNLKVFFDYAATARVNFLQTSPEEIIEKSGAKPPLTSHSSGPRDAAA